MKKHYYIRVYDRDTNKLITYKCYWQKGRISAFCNSMFRKFGERVACDVYEDGLLVETWGA